MCVLKESSCPRSAGVATMWGAESCSLGIAPQCLPKALDPLRMVAARSGLVAMIRIRSRKGPWWKLWRRRTLIRLNGNTLVGADLVGARLVGADLRKADL